MKTLLILFFIAIAFAIAGQYDYKEEQADQRLYCEMVERWYNDAAKGIPPEDRAGWPPFDGECK